MDTVGIYNFRKSLHYILLQGRLCIVVRSAVIYSIKTLLQSAHIPQYWGHDSYTIVIQKCAVCNHADIPA